MSSETVSVRMNRSENSIRWGFILSKSGNKIIIQNVEPGSLSDKAGLRNGDFVETISGRQTVSMGLQEANEIVNQARYEIYFTLQRHVTSHSCLPWTLSEKDNKLVVDQIQPGFGYTHNSFNTRQQGHSNAPYRSSSNYSSDQQYSSSCLLNSNTVNSCQSVGLPRTQSFGKQTAAPFGNHCHTLNNKTISAVSPAINPIPSWNNGNTLPSSVSNRNSVKFTDNTINKQSFPRKDCLDVKNENSPSFCNSIKTSTLPLNQQTTIQTSIPNGNEFRNGSRGLGSISPGGSRIHYHSPSSRSRRDLSPNSSIEHLQYNSPMNLYSPGAVAEQFTMQTGRELEGQRSQNNTPAYLNSETKKYIEEVEGRMHRGLSPSCQSSSFKRISQAVGAVCE